MQWNLGYFAKNTPEKYNNSQLDEIEEKRLQIWSPEGGD